MSVLQSIVDALQKGWLDYTNAALVALTLGVLVYYTIETFRLRQAAQQQNEIAVKPMFAVYVESLSNGAARRIVLENVGLGPAFNISIVHPQWDGKKLVIGCGTNVMKPGQVQELLFHHEEGQTGTNLQIDSLYQWVNTGKIPNPLNIVLRCVSVDHRPYEFLFNCTPHEGRFKITFAGVTVPPGP